MSSLKIFLYQFIILISISYVFTYEYKATEINEKYPKIKELPSGEFYVIMSKGIYIYNNDFSNKTQIYNFTNDKESITNENEAHNKVVISDIRNDTKYFILSLVKNYIYLYDFNNNNISKINLNSDLSTGVYYNLIPYKFINNDLHYLIIYSKMEDKKCSVRFTNIKYDKFSLNFLDYKIGLFNELNNAPKKKYKYYLELCSSFISDSIFNCHMISQNKVLCIYIVEKSKAIYISVFDVENLEKISKISNYDQKIYSDYINKIFQIKSDLSTKTNSIYICFYWQYDNFWNYEYYTDCLIYNIEEKNIVKSYNSFINAQNFQVNYFNDTKSYIKILNGNNNYITLYKINETTNDYDNYTDIFDICKKINNFTLIYNNSINGYNLIFDCENNDKWYIIHNITIFPSFSQKSTNIPIPDEILFISGNESMEIEEEEIEVEKEIEEEIGEVKEEEEKNEDIEENTQIEINFEAKSSILEEKTEYKDKYEIIELPISKEDLIENLTGLINTIEIGKNYEYIGEDYNLVIKPSNSSCLESETHINFTQCEKILRNTHNISSSRILTFLQMEINNKNEKSLTNKVEYQVYDDNKTLLDLSVCNNLTIQVFHAIKDTSLIDKDSLLSFKDSGVDIFNINDSFFNDICHPYSDSNNDIVLEDRIKDIYQNYTLCDNGCNYNEINTDYMTVSCDCKVKTNMSTNETSNITKLDEIKTDSNFALIKCYKLVFSFEGKLKNIGFWIFLILIIIYFPLLFLYIIKGVKPIKEYLIQEMTKYGYINGKNNKINKITKKSAETQGENNNIIKNRRNKKRNAIHPPPKNKKIISAIKNESKSKKDNNKNKNKLDNSSNFKQIKSIDQNVIKFKKNIKNEKGLKIKIMKGNRIKHIEDTLVDGSNTHIIKNEQGLQTQGTNKVEKSEKGNNIFNFSLININLNNIKEKTPKETTSFILNNYTFEDAIKNDMRSVCAVFYIILLSKEALFYAFLYKSPLVLFPLRFCHLIFIICFDLALNSFFYFEDNISEKYKYTKNIFLFTFSKNITIILLSTCIVFVFMTLFINLSNSANNIREVFRTEEEKLKKNKKYKVSEKRKKEIFVEIEKILKKYKLKVIIIIVIEIIFLLFFWYYVTAFCHVYTSTQLSWLLDSFLSILSRLVIILLLCLGFAKLYRIAVESNTHCLYKFVLFFYSFG